MKDNMLLQENLNTVVSGVDALSILSKIVQGKEPSLDKDDVAMGTVLIHLSAALLSSQKNNLDTSSHATKELTQKDVIRNNINSSECFSTDANDNDTIFQMSTDSEPFDSDDQSEPEIGYEEELLSRMLYYGQFENLEAAATPAKTNSVQTSSCTPLASSTMIEDCSESTLRNNRRRKNRSTPLASSTMMEDLIADIKQQNQETDSSGSIITWSIDNSINTASLKEYYHRYFGVDSNDSDSESDTTDMSTRLSSTFNADDSFSSDDDSEVTSSDYWNGNHHYPRTSTSVNLNEMTNDPSPLKNGQKKTTKSKQPVSKLLFFIRGIKRNITRKTSSKDISRR
ncbi:Hypothetical predicted protein [Mytilus galloprovincialis]|uniref:Uncharacterized protein n=1 Tax=Mytilus galloprovincialis TaxID=29158 RepID=A0A8B6EWB0_MYTGA|nr:Hypothetical predicted protein [Mytilus galloprovincialis]VDI40740.1 Hypothetical predicted protein [Mytilus galloprovincialis]